MTAFLLSLALAAAAQSPSASPTSAPCVPEGNTVPHAFDRPRLGQPGDPVGAEWVDRDPNLQDGSGDPQAYEADPLSNDDPMGAAAPVPPGDSAEVPVTNSGGDLAGPNGEDQNGAGEGPCIEVYVEWTYRYPVTVQRSHHLSLWGASTGETETFIIWREGKKRSKIKEICPCA